MDFTGERFIPGTRGEIWLEHWHRYHFAARWARGKRVLDVACGEGYGTALLARHAAHVTGVDLAPAAIAHARATYAGLGNAEFIEASCTQMPLADASFDAVVSFETLEHIPAQEEFLAEVARVLKPEGVLVLSCPNKLEYSDKRDFANEFHVKELYREELAALVARHFPAALWLGQRLSFFSVIAPEGTAAAGGEFLEVTEDEPVKTGTQLAHPLYFLIAASRSSAAVQGVPPALSVLSDRDDWFYRDYGKVIRDLAGTAVQRDYAEKLVAERDGTIEALERDIAAWQKQKAADDARFEQARAQSERTLAERDQQIHAREAIIAEQAHEVARRQSVRWWLKLPFIRLKALLRK
jgi:2-polyprenyl-3-methyl-5-hydroxy-6-metoxy-1,4-benzoquinol methylase